MKSVLLVIFSSLAFIAVDLVLTLVSYGFYTESFVFKSSLLWKHAFLSDGYNFLTIGFDFFGLSILRTILLVFGLIKFMRQSTPRLSLLFTGLELTNISYSFTKLLAFSEFTEQLRYPGIYFSLVWNELAWLLTLVIWIFLFRSEKIKEDVGFLWPSNVEDTERLIPESSDPESTATGPASNNLTPGAPKIEKEPLRISTLKHVSSLLSYCGHHKEWFIAGFFFLTFYSFARVFQPHFTAQVITNIVRMKTLSDLVNSVLIMSGLCLVITITGGFRGGCFDYATALINKKMRADLFKSIMTQEIAFFDEKKTGEIVSRLTSDCQTMSTTVSTNVNVFMRNGVMLIGSIVFMFTISWRLTVVTFICIPLAGFITKTYGAYYDKLSERTQEAIAQANQIADQAIGSIRTVRSFACESNEYGRFDDKLDFTLKISRKKAIAYMGYTWMNEFVDNSILIAILFYGGHLVLSKKMDVDGLFSFLLYQLQVGEALYNIGYVFTGLMEAVGASRKVFEYMHRKPQIAYDGVAKPSPLKGEVSFSEVTFTYPSRPSTVVLDNVSFDVKPGETVALVGPSGAGKSSIISLLEHFYEINGGTISLDGVKISDFDHKYFHQKVALVAQEPVLYDGTVRYNILYGCEEWADDDDMIRAAKLANIHEFIMETKDGYDTECGERGLQFSGGQKQRIAIARALVRQPAVLILDEATSALDAESEHIIQEALQKCSVNRTVIVIAHRLSTVEKADRIIVINKGKVLQQGNHSDLMKNPQGLYYSLVQRQLLQTTDETKE